MARVSTFVMLYKDGLDSIAKQWNLDDAEYRALHVLAMLADTRTGEIRDITRRAIATHIGWGPHKTLEVMDRLVAHGLIEVGFVRGHAGSVTVLCHPQIVRSRSYVDRASEQPTARAAVRASNARTYARATRGNAARNLSIYRGGAEVEDASPPRDGIGRGEAKLNGSKSYAKHKRSGREVGAGADASRAYLSPKIDGNGDRYADRFLGDEL